MRARVAGALLLLAVVGLLVLTFSTEPPPTPPPRAESSAGASTDGGSRARGAQRRPGPPRDRGGATDAAAEHATHALRIGVVDAASGRDLHPSTFLETADGEVRPVGTRPGRDSVDVPSAGRHRVWCVFDGSEEVAAEAWVEPHQTEVCLRIPPEATVAGRVIDGTGRPAAGVRVFVSAEDRLLVWSCTTDVDGGFVSGPVAPGRYLVRALVRSGRSHEGTSSREQVEAGDRDVVVHIRRRPSIEVHVRDVQGRPVPGLKLRATLVGSRSDDSQPADGGRVSVAAHTRPDGLARFLDLIDGRYRLELAAEPRARRGYSLIESVETSTGAEDVVVRVRRGVVIEGVVVDREGRPVEDAEVEAHGGPDGSLVYALTDAEGRFELAGLESGLVFELRATSQEGAATIARDVAAGDLGVRLELGDRKTLRGRFSKRFAGVRLRFVNERTGEVVDARINELGGVDVIGLAPGAQRVSVWVASGDDAGREVQLGTLDADRFSLASLDLEAAFD